VQVRGDGDAAAFVAGVDEAVEALGGVGSDREQSDVVELCGYPHRSTYAEIATMPMVAGKLLVSEVTGLYRSA
jgi:hypothetical protein